MVQTYFVSNKIVRSHDCKGLTQYISDEIKTVINETEVAAQTVALAFDGQYFQSGTYTLFTLFLLQEKLRLL